MRRLVTVIAAAVLLSAAPASAQVPDAALTSVGDGGPFPEREYVLTLPEGAEVAPGAVRVREANRDVRDLRVMPADAVRGTSGVVLVLDASGSMEGRAIEDAMDAARAFADRRADGQALGIVVFNERARVILPPTTDEARIRQALTEAPPLAPETAIHDGIGRALALLGESGVDAGSIVVLSDGSDTASTLTGEEIAGAARRQDVRIFSIGLVAGAFSPAALRDLAEHTGGGYSATSSSGSLKGLFDDLGSQLANELVLTYRSLEPAGSTVDVVASAPGGLRATATYLAPAIAEVAAEQPGPGGFWISTAGIVVVAVGIAGLLAIAMALFTREPRQERLRKRMTAFGVVTESQEEDGVPGRALGAVYGQLQRRLSGASRWQRFEEAVSVARIPQSPIALASRTAIGAALTLVLPTVFGATPLVGIGLAAVVVTGVGVYLKTMLRRQRLQFADQLADSLQVMAAALRAGHSLAGALSSVVNDAPEPTRTEFARVRADEKLGAPIEECINRMAARMDNRDLKQVATVASLQQQTGGNTAEVLDRVVESVRERGDLRRLVRSLTAQGRIGHLVITGLPVGVGGYLFVTNRDYLQPLFEPGTGQILLIASVVMGILGSYFIRRIVDIKV